MSSGLRVPTACRRRRDGTFTTKEVAGDARRLANFDFTAADRAALEALRRALSARLLGDQVTKTAAVRHAIRVTLRMEELAAASAKTKGAKRK